MWVDLRLGKKKRKCIEEEAMTSATGADLKEPRPSDIVVVCPALPLGEWQLGIAGSCSLRPWPQSSTFISSQLPSPFSSPRVFCTGQQVPLGPGEQHIGLQVCSTQCKEHTHRTRGTRSWSCRGWRGSVNGRQAGGSGTELFRDLWDTRRPAQPGVGTPGLAMAAPRPPPAISVSVSAPAFYAPQKKFAPVVAPKPKVNPFRPGDSEPSVAAGAQRAQMGRVGEIPPPPPEDFPLPPPPLIGEGDDSEGAFPPPPPPMIEEPFPPAPLEEEIFPSPPPPLEEEGGPEAPTQLPPQPREKVSSIDLEIDSLSSLLDDMTKNDPFKARVSSGYVPPPVATPFIPKPNTKPVSGGTAPLPPWKTPSSSQPPPQPQAKPQVQLHVQPQAKPQVQPQPMSSPNAQARGPLSQAPTPAPKFAPVAPKFTPVAPKFSPGAPSGPGSQPSQKAVPLEAPSSVGTGSPQPPSFTYAQQKEKPLVQEKQLPVPPPAQNQNQTQVRSPGGPGPLTLKEVEELEQLTQQLMQDMEHPQRQSVSVNESCGRCKQPLPRAQPAVRALGQLFHISCFTCQQCQQQLQGGQFYSLEGTPYCEGCYTETLEKCNTCGQPITDRMLRATGKAYHPQCFTCVVCACPLEGTSFIMDQRNQPHCVSDYHKQYAPRCSVCSEPIMPEPGRDETVRVVALDKNFHMKCYKCEDCGKPLSIEADDNGCFPLDGHVLCRKCHTARAQT